jgi:hypothetical protein
VGDREIAPFLTAVLDPGMLQLPRAARVANGLTAAYWGLVRRAL